MPLGQNRKAKIDVLGRLTKADAYLRRRFCREAKFIKGRDDKLLHLGELYAHAFTIQRRKALAKQKPLAIAVSRMIDQQKRRSLLDYLDELGI